MKKRSSGMMRNWCLTRVPNSYLSVFSLLLMLLMISYAFSLGKMLR